MQFRCNLDAIYRCNSDAMRCIIYVIQIQNLDLIRTDSEMHLITYKLDENINQKPDQQTKIQIKLDAIPMQFRSDKDKILMKLDALQM